MTCRKVSLSRVPRLSRSDRVRTRPVADRGLSASARPGDRCSALGRGQGDKRPFRPTDTADCRTQARDWPPSSLPRRRDFRSTERPVVPVPRSCGSWPRGSPDGPHRPVVPGPAGRTTEGTPALARRTTREICMTTTITRRPSKRPDGAGRWCGWSTLATVGLIFDGYDLVVYGTVLSTFLNDPTQIGEVTPGSRRNARQLRAGRRAGRRTARRQRRRHRRPAQGDAARLRVVLHRHGRHRPDDTPHMFGVMRFVTGLGVGALVATTGARRRDRPAGKEESLQRHHLLRRALREPAGRVARPSSCWTRSAGAACS